MGDTSIQWTDKVYNPVTGCNKISQGCKHCYANTIADRFFARQYPANADGSPRKFTDVRCHEDRLGIPLRWRKPARIFVNSMSDLFHEDVPFEFINKVVGITYACEQHLFQILTKRAERMLDFSRWLEARGLSQWPANVHLGVSVENQAAADERIPLLLQTPAAVRWLSVEPMIGPVELDDYIAGMDYTERVDGAPTDRTTCGLDWVVCGGESGSGARPFDISWAREIMAQCRAAGVPVFMKQLGRNPVGAKPLKLKDSHGGDMNEWPEDLRIREFPKL